MILLFFYIFLKNGISSFMITLNIFFCIDCVTCVSNSLKLRSKSKPFIVS